MQSRLSGLESQHGGKLLDLSAKLRARYEEELEAVQASKTAADRFPHNNTRQVKKGV